MSHFFIKNLYGEYIAKNFSLNKDDNKYLLELESTNDSVLCPFCHKKTSRIHQKTKRKIIDTVYSRIIIVTFYSRKYKCVNCNKIFTEENLFTVGKYKYSSRVLNTIIDSYTSYSEKKTKKRITLLEEKIPDFEISKNELTDIIKKREKIHKDLYNKNTNILYDITEYYAGIYYDAEEDDELWFEDEVLEQKRIKRFLKEKKIIDIDIHDYCFYGGFEKH